MTFMNYLISSFVGSIIGYITNYIAIKMLFRPRREKRIFGFKVPFTPGLIPKEKTRIAKNIGEAVGTHLLTKEQLTSNIFNDKMEKNLENIIENNLKKIKNSQATVLETINNIFHYDKEMELYIKEKITKSLFSFIEKDETKEKLIDLIEKEIDRYLKRDLKKLKDSSTYKFLKQSLYSKVDTFKESKQSSVLTKEIVKNIINPLLTSDYRIKDLITNDIKLQLRNYIENNEEAISKELLKFLHEEKTEKDIEIIISKVIGSQINPMMAMFLKPENLKEKIYSFLDDYLKEKEGQEKVSDTIYSIIEKFMEKTPSQISYEIDKNLSEDTKLRLIETTKKSIINASNLEVAMTSLEEKIESHTSIKELLSDFNEDIIDNIYIYLKTIIYDFIDSENLKNNLQDITGNVYDDIVNMKISDLFLEIEDQEIKIISEKIRILIMNFIKNQGSVFIDEINISEIIEENINSFPVEFAEELILDIASKELNAITWLGALLGAIMGLLSPIINNFIM